MTTGGSQRFIVFMGIAGSGKSLLGRRLADRLDLTFIEGDAYHTEANREKMRSGQGLTDEERLPWLRSVCAAAKAGTAGDRGAVIACSALRRSYRDLLRRELGSVGFLYLEGEKTLFSTRLCQRQGHFASESLLASQLAALEPLDADEAGTCIPAAQDPDAILEMALAYLSAVVAARSGAA